LDFAHPFKEHPDGIIAARRQHLAGGVETPGHRATGRDIRNMRLLELGPSGVARLRFARLVLASTDVPPDVIS
jgi:hypothetical protein